MNAPFKPLATNSKISCNIAIHIRQFVLCSLMRQVSFFLTQTLKIYITDEILKLHFFPSQELPYCNPLLYSRSSQIGMNYGSSVCDFFYCNRRPTWALIDIFLPNKIVIISQLFHGIFKISYYL